MLTWLGVATAVAVAAAQDDYVGGLDVVPSLEGEPAAPVPAPEQDCYSSGSVAGAVVGTFLATLALIAVAIALYKIYWRGRRGKHLILVKDPEAAGDQYAFDNPCFRDGSPLARTAPEKDPSRLDQKAKWTGWPSLGALAGGKSGDKRRAQDDSCIATGEPPAQQRLVTLRSRDFTGLGFNVCGNMRDGIFVRDVLHRGPAFESGRIQPGDRIEAVRISFRHMVFEDALTILSYASPYEVQLELGSAPPATAPAAAGSAASLLRPRRSGSAISAAERIVHPFFRSQSSADLAQISKASLKRVQQMGGVGGGRCPSSHSTEEFRNNEYPTLKLSSSPHLPKESARFEKTAPTAVVKPERVKRASTPKQPDASPTSEPGTLSKFQKFGVRVLPDPTPPRAPAAEAEKHQNEQNLIKERVNTNPFNCPQGQDTVDSGSIIDSLPYDERGIDVGPVDPQSSLSLQERKQEISEKQGHRSASGEEEEGHKENNVKHLLTKGLQNLKEKLHHDKKKNTGSPESPLRNKDKKQKPARQHTTSMSSDSESLDSDRVKEDLMKGKLIPKEESEKIERKRQRNPEKDGAADPVPPPPDSGIPSEIPEEVRRAAVAARSNRKSLLQPGNVSTSDVKKDHIVQVPRESISDSSSDGEGGPDAGTEAGRPPKRSNKRKAPPPPADDAEANHTVSENILKNGHFEEDINVAVTRNGHMFEKDENVLEADIWMKGNQSNSDGNTITESGKTITTFANLEEEKPDTSAKDVTNITIDDGASSILASLASKRNVESDIVSGQSNSFPVDSSSSGTSTMETKTVDYDNGIHVTTVNSDSDSDLERLEGDDDMYEGKRSKKGGTTIELNSSHITIHHSPSSDTMQMAAELESDSTRKAASLGDLSRLDSEQPMSVLERAVSLDLGDGGTPHSSKKRKAPLPPPGEDYLSSTQDTDDGAHYRKEPRLDNAMDTFQRRRLKKSSDWGTLEEALKQTDNSLASQKFEPNVESSSVDAGLIKFTESITLKQDIQMETLNLPDDQKVKLSDLSQKFSDIVRADAINISGIEPLNDKGKINTTQNKLENMELSGRSSPECDHGVGDQGENEVNVDTKKGNLQDKRTVLLVSPQLTEEDAEQKASKTIETLSSSGEASQIKIVPSSSVLGFRRIENESVRHEGNIDGDVDTKNSTLSSQVHTSSIKSSTPVPNRENLHTLSHSIVTSSPEHSFIKESVQSPLVTSSDAGISNIHVSSTTQERLNVPSEINCSQLVSSVSDHFVTAATNMVDSTTVAEELSDNEATWGSDLQPPELPTSPVPVLPQSTSSFAGSPSMTYITEIQVVTTTDSENDQTIGSSNLELTSNGASPDATFAQGVKNNRSESSLSSDSISSGKIGDHEIDEDPRESNLPSTNDTIQGQISKTNVTVTSIRTNESDHSKGQSGGRITEATLNHVAEKKARSVRPPVPPRRSDFSSPPSSPPAMSSSTIMVEVPKIRLTETTSSNLLAGGSVSQVNPAAAAGKFISFSSLSPRTEGGTGRHSSSFEQWVFLDESPPESHHNGLEACGAKITDNGQHSNVMTLPSLIPNRSQTVTHIILDTKQNNGSPLQD